MMRSGAGRWVEFNTVCTSENGPTRQNPVQRDRTWSNETEPGPTRQNPVLILQFLHRFLFLFLSRGPELDLNLKMDLKTAEFPPVVQSSGGAMMMFDPSVSTHRHGP